MLTVESVVTRLVAVGLQKGVIILGILLIELFFEFYALRFSVFELQNLQIISYANTMIKKFNFDLPYPCLPVRNEVDYECVPDFLPGRVQLTQDEAPSTNTKIRYSQIFSSIEYLLRTSTAPQGGYKIDGEDA